MSVTGMVPAFQQYFFIGLGLNGKIAIRSKVFATQFFQFFVFHDVTFFLFLN
jgi:hypothetical protein